MVDLDKMLDQEGPERVEAALRLWVDNPLSQYFRQRLDNFRTRLVEDVFSGSGSDVRKEVGEYQGLKQLESEIEEVMQKIKQLKEKD